MIREIFGNLTHQCDKFEHYFELYEQWFAKFVNKSPKVLEVGVLYGGSAEMWSKYFGSGTVVHGVDIYPQCSETDYLKITRGDQGSEEFWESFNSPEDGFDIVIDDGSHDSPHQITTLKKTFKLLKDGGVYWCEDVHTSYYKGVRVRDGGYLNSKSYLEYSKRVINVLNAHHTFYAIGVGETPTGPHVDQELIDLYGRIRGIHFYDSIVIIEKGKRRPFRRLIYQPPS